MALALIVGMPYGARHLNDTIVADIMDYDEFITGKPNQHPGTHSTPPMTWLPFV